jgi:hypothetical protein
MLLWESFCGRGRRNTWVRLPGDTRCAAVTKKGTRCKGRIHTGSEYCYFHDPDVERPARRAASKRRAYHVDGVSSRLTTRRGITQALERLVHDTQMGIVPPDVGRALFEMLERMLHLYYETRPRRNPRQTDRSRAARLLRRLAKTYVKAERGKRQVIPRAPASARSAAPPATGPQTVEQVRVPDPAARSSLPAGGPSRVVADG